MEITEEKKSFPERVAEKLIEQLKQGTAPWQKPWEPGVAGSFIPHNPTTGKRYRGINAIQLLSEGREDPRWMTYQQAKGEDAQVRKGEKGTPIQYWKFTEEQTKLDGNGKPFLDGEGNPVKELVRLERPKVFSATVFNAQQIDGLPPFERKQQSWDAIERAEHILQASGADIRHGQENRAFYRPATDSIHMPDRGQFPEAAGYYATALHELGHWTGHTSRLDRDLSNPFGSEGYAREELRAEIASMIVGDDLGIGHDPGQHAAYVGSWIKALQDDPLEIFRAASDAEKIHGYLQALEQQQIQEQSQAQGQEWNPEEMIQRVWDWQSTDQRITAGPIVEALTHGRPDRAIEILEFRPENFPPPRHMWPEGMGELRDAIAGHWRQWQEANGLGPSVTPEGKRSFESIPNDLSQLSQPAQKGQQPSDEDFIRDTRILDVLAELNNDRNSHLETQAEASAEMAYEHERQTLNNPASTDEDVTAAYTASQVAEGQAMRESDQNERQAKEAGQRQEQSNRNYIDVPFSQKEEAKALGAKWDRQEQSWYIPPKLDPAQFVRWERKPEPAEDKQKAEQPEGPQRQQRQQRLYLAVPYGEHHAAKAHGAQWDKNAKSWYAGPNADMAKLQRWMPENVHTSQGPALSPREEFAEALKNIGAVIGGEHPIMDGRKHRIATEGDAKGETAGFYVGHLDGHPAGYIKNNRTGLEMRWKSKGYALDPEEKAKIQAEATGKLEARAIEQERTQEQTAQRVSKQLGELVPIIAATPYLQAKGIAPQTGAFTDPEGQTNLHPGC